jgi:hypothetical protein
LHSSGTGCLLEDEDELLNDAQWQIGNLNWETFGQTDGGEGGFKICV